MSWILFWYLLRLLSLANIFGWFLLVIVYIFWDEVFSLIMLFGLTSSSKLFFPQRFGRLILRPSSGLSRTRELWNFEPNPLLFRGYHVLIPLRPLLLLLLNAVAAAAAASIDAVTDIVLSLPLFCHCHCTQDWTQHLGGLPIFDSTP